MAAPKPTTGEAVAWLAEQLRSPNVPDDNLETANVVDVINRHARATSALAKAIEALAIEIGGLSRALAERTG